LNEKILSYLENTGLKVIPFPKEVDYLFWIIHFSRFPKGAAARLPMLDNALFKDFKIDFNKIWISNNRYLSKKKWIVKEVWKNFPKKRIIGYWKKCGYPRKLSRKSFAASVTVMPSKKNSIGTKDIRSFFIKE
jgi:hypothetical protein